jgi:hypothetical protein
MMIMELSLYTPLWRRDEVLKVVQKNKFFPDLRKGQGFHSVNFLMIIMEGDRLNKKHPTQ